jgi:hypothetical protein
MVRIAAEPPGRRSFIKLPGRTGRMGWLRSFLSDRFRVTLLLALGIVFIAALLLNEEGGRPVAGGGIHFFYHPQCPHCHDQIPFNAELERTYNLTIVAHDVTVPAERELFLNVTRTAGLAAGTPTTVVGSFIVVGYSPEIAAQIEEAVQRYLRGEASAKQQDGTVSIPFLGEIDPMTVSLPLLAVLLGLVDGFNPCAMWVLVYLISMLMGVKEKRRIWIVVGSFLLASAVLYFLFMTAWLNAFLLIGYVRPLTMLIGLAALYFGAVSMRDFIQKKGMECEVTSGSGKKRLMKRADRLTTAPLTVMTIGGIVVLAFLVNSIEFVCSSALPAVFTQVLALSNVSTAAHYGYILLYLLFFMIDDLIIFGLAAFAISSSFGERYARQCKLIGGILLLALGALLVFAPNLLR